MKRALLVTAALLMATAPAFAATSARAQDADEGGTLIERLARDARRAQESGGGGDDGAGRGGDRGGRDGGGRDGGGRDGGGRDGGGRDGGGRDGGGRDGWDRGGRDRGGWDRGGDRWDQDRPGWGGSDWGRDHHDRDDFRRRWDRDGWRRDFDRERRHDWWRGNSWFRNYSGFRMNFYYAPSYGYYSVPRQYWGRTYRVGDYLPRMFWRYAVNDWSWYRLPRPPYGTQWVYVDNNIFLVDQRDGYIIDAAYSVWNW